MSAVLMRYGRRIAIAGFQGVAQVTGTDVLTLRLFSNDYQPLPDDDGSEYTEAAFTGYAAVTFAYEDNGDPTEVSSEWFSKLNNADFVWDCTAAPETIYGWYLHDDTNGALVAAERYETPHVLAVGSRHTLIANLKAGDCSA